jgi:hypothetical protein
VTAHFPAIEQVRKVALPPLSLFVIVFRHPSITGFVDQSTLI